MRAHKHPKHTQIPLLLLALVGAGFIFFLLSQNDKTALPPNPAQATLPDPQPEPSVPIVEPIVASASYHLLTTTSTTPGAELTKEVGSKNVAFTLALNRLDVKHIPAQAVLVIPDSFDDTSIYSPLPSTIAAAMSVPKLLVVSQKVQAFGAYEYGTLVRWGTVSTGKQSTPTPSMLYNTNWKGKLVTSNIDEEWIMPWYFNLDNDEGVSIHQFDLPGYPASHACIRLSEEDAIWFYDWAEQWILAPDGQTKLADGTPVIVYGEYAYGKTAPWKKLAEDPHAIDISQDEAEQIVQKYLSDIQSRIEKRNKILNPSTQAQ